MNIAQELQDEIVQKRAREELRRVVGVNDPQRTEGQYLAQAATATRFATAIPSKPQSQSGLQPIRAPGAAELF